ncbi:MAG: hypothetical protein ACPIOQ_03815, partial [Promethearchaeia archaeon]
NNRGIITIITQYWAGCVARCDHVASGVNTELLKKRGIENAQVLTTRARDEDGFVTVLCTSGSCHGMCGACRPM